MNKTFNFKHNDKVFAKIKGYPPWPANVLGNDGKKYKVKFYGTGEIGLIRREDMFYYKEYKLTFEKKLKRKDYSDAFDEIEVAIKANGGSDGNPNAPNNTSSTDKNPESQPPNPKKRPASGELFPTPENPAKKAAIDTRKDSVEQEETGKKPTPLKGKQGGRRSASTTQEAATEQIKSNAVPKEDDKDTTKKKQSKKRLLVEEERSEDEEVNDELGEEEKENVNKQASQKTSNDTEKIQGQSLTMNESDYAYTIITEAHLKALIEYAEFVRHNKSKYENEPIDHEEATANEVLIAKAPSGKLVIIPYNHVPPHFDNEFARSQYEEKEAIKVLGFKEKVESGALPPDTGIDVQWDQCDVDRIIHRQILQRQQAKLNWWYRESSLVELDSKLKVAFGLKEADPVKGLEYLNRTEQVDVHSLMLKKHAHVVDTIRRLRRYIGNVGVWKMEEDRLNQFREQAEKIREISHRIYTKFMKFFGEEDTEDTARYPIFSNLADTLREQCTDMSEADFFNMWTEPNSRKAYLDKVNDELEEEMEKDAMDKDEESTSKGSNSAASPMSDKSQ